MKYFINLLPIVLNILLLPFWYLETTYGFWIYGRTSFFEIILNCIFVPIFLLVFNVRYIYKQEVKVWIDLLMMFSSVICAAFIHYYNWGIVTGRFFKPDSMTIALIFWLEVVFPLVMICIGISIYGIYTVIKKRKSQDMTGRSCQGDGSVDTHARVCQGDGSVDTQAD